MADHHPGEGAEQRQTLVERGERVGQEGGALALDDLVELCDRGRVAGGRSGLLDGRHPLLLWLVWGSYTTPVALPAQALV